MDNIKVAAPSFPIGAILFLIFMTLKLCGIITWSWWLITAPLWAIPAFILGLMVLAGIIAGVTLVFSALRGRYGK